MQIKRQNLQKKRRCGAFAPCRGRNQVGIQSRRNKRRNSLTEIENTGHYSAGHRRIQDRRGVLMERYPGIAGYRNPEGRE